MQGRDFGSKPGSGGVMSSHAEGLARRERLKQLALETVDLARDPFFMKNHLGCVGGGLCESFTQIDCAELLSASCA